MLSFFANRLLGLVVSLLVISLLLFLALNVIPGKASTAALGTNPSPEAIAAFEARYGLDQPLPNQYLNWLGGALRGDFGRSVQTDVSISDEIAKRLPVTFQLTFFAVTIALLISVPLALLAARYVDGPIDVAVSIVSLAGLALPSFALATALVLFVSLQLRWLPPGGFVPFFEDPVQNLRLMIMPSLALGVVSGGVMMRILRSSLVTAMNRDFALISRSRGATRGQVLVRHAVPVAAVPFMTFSAVELSAIFGGALIIERIFQLPGIGSLVMLGIETRDFRLLQAAAMVIAAFVMVVNLLIDLVGAWIDPRLRRLSAQ
jgi:peptide/nickel transport system permease protein